MSYQLCFDGIKHTHVHFNIVCMKRDKGFNILLINERFAMLTFAVKQHEIILLTGTKCDGKTFWK